MHGREVTKGEVAPLALSPVCSVLLCKSVRNRTPPRYEMSHKQIAGEFFLSRWGVFSLTELTELTEPFCARFEPTEGLRHTENTERYCYRWGENCERQGAVE